MAIQTTDQVAASLKLTRCSLPPPTTKRSIASMTTNDGREAGPQTQTAYGFHANFLSRIPKSKRPAPKWTRAVECQRSLAIAAKVLLAALFCCPGAGSLKLRGDDTPVGSYSPLG